MHASHKLLLHAAAEIAAAPHLPGDDNGALAPVSLADQAQAGSLLPLPRSNANAGNADAAAGAPAGNLSPRSRWKKPRQARARQAPDQAQHASAWEDPALPAGDDSAAAEAGNGGGHGGSSRPGSAGQEGGEPDLALEGCRGPGLGDGSPGVECAAKAGGEVMAAPKKRAAVCGGESGRAAKRPKAPQGAEEAARRPAIGPSLWELAAAAQLPPLRAPRQVAFTEVPARHAAEQGPAVCSPAAEADAGVVERRQPEAQSSMQGSGLDQGRELSAPQASTAIGELGQTGSLSQEPLAARATARSRCRNQQQGMQQVHMEPDLALSQLPLAVRASASPHASARRELHRTSAQQPVQGSYRQPHGPEDEDPAMLDLPLVERAKMAAGQATAASCGQPGNIAGQAVPIAAAAAEPEGHAEAVERVSEEAAEQLPKQQPKQQQPGAWDLLDDLGAWDDDDWDPAADANIGRSPPPDAPSTGMRTPFRAPDSAAAPSRLHAAQQGAAVTLGTPAAAAFEGCEVAGAGDAAAKTGPESSTGLHWRRPLARRNNLAIPDSATPGAFPFQ